MAKKHNGKCPFCDQYVIPSVIEENTIRRDVCKCPKCSGQLLVCRTPGCHDYAKGGEIYDDELCPSCTESLASGTGEIVKWGLMTAATAVATAAVATTAVVVEKIKK